MKALCRVFAGARKSLTFQIIVLVWIITIPLCVLFVVNTREAQAIILKQTENSIQSTADVYTNQLDEQMSAVNSYLYELSVSSTAFVKVRDQNSSTPYAVARTNLINEMYNNIYYNGNADVFYFYSPDLESGGLAKRSDYSEARKTVLQQALFQSEYLEEHLQWSCVFLDDSEWLMRNTTSLGPNYGALINLDEILETIYGNLPYKTVEVLWSDAGEIVTDSQKLMVVSDLERADCYLCISVKKSEIIESLPAVQRFGYAWSVLILGLSVLMILLLNRIVIRPLRVLNQALVAFGEDHPEERIVEKPGTREFEKTYRYFNEMASNISELKIDNYEKELAANRMELKNLQLQIRPHFLLNTFNLMYSYTVIGEMKSLQKLILYMAEYFRYLYKSGRQLVPFHQEMSLIEHYMEISRLNYNGEVIFTSRIDPEMQEVDVPPLLVHNFVENIFKHAMDQDKVMHIDLQADVRAGRVEIQVADNGVGMRGETVRQLNEYRNLDQTDSMHVGWMNSIRRLRFFYGEEASLVAESAEGEGSIITIRFPYVSDQGRLDE